MRGGQRHWQEVGGGTVIPALNDTPLGYLHPEERLAAALLAVMDQNQGQKNDKDRRKDDPLSSLKPVASFDCKSGALLWGQLDTVLDAKANLKNQREFDGAKQPDCGPSGTIWVADHKFHCQAMKGRWSKYYYEAEDKFLFFCHDDSLTPRQLVERGKKLRFSRNPDPDADGGIFVNRYDWGYHYRTPFSAKWKTMDNDIILTDPSWKLDVPPLCGPDVPQLDLDYDEMMGAPEVILPKLNAAWKTVGSNTVALMDSDGEDCGLFCSALYGTEYLYGRLIFNEMKQLIGFGVTAGTPGDGGELYGVHSQ